MPVLYMTDEEYARYVNIKKEIGAIKTRLYGVRARRLDEQLRLVYVEESYYLEGFHTCYFTAMDIQDATGDDWDDDPYEHNAGEPNQFDKVYFIQGVTTPNNEYLNSPYTVEGINRGEVPWLTDRVGNQLYAGATEEEFLVFMREALGGIYF